MRALIQRVTSASVTVSKNIIGQIGNGFAILLGVQAGDSENEAEYLAKKISELRIFTDSNDKMNLSILEIEGEALVVSQFTLYADCSKGRRPSFIRAEQPKRADELYQYFVTCLRQNGIDKVQTGEFGSLMEFSIHNHGPVTIMLDTDDMKRKGK
jgi:D-tyrosyl-tRNA(Tyr) deacylase